MVSYRTRQFVKDSPRNAVYAFFASPGLFMLTVVGVVALVFVLGWVVLAYATTYAAALIALVVFVVIVAVVSRRRAEDAAPMATMPPPVGKGLRYQPNGSVAGSVRPGDPRIAAFYADPWGLSRWRFWDGSAWTGQVRD